ncbi:MAG: integrase [Psychrobacter glaciei]|jgi:integrase
MATFRKRQKADGAISHTAYIRIKRGGEVIYTESKTFSKDVLAKGWAKRREVELEDSAELKRSIVAKSSGVDSTTITLGELIDRYIDKVKPLKPWGATKQNVLDFIKTHNISKLPAETITTKNVVDYIVMRSQQSSPQTANQDYMYIRQVFSVAEDLLGVNVDFTVIEKAQRTLSKIGAIAKSRERDRRPEIEELNAMLTKAFNKRTMKRAKSFFIPIDKLIVFAMFSGRRQSEITRISRSDTDFERQEVLVRDMKHPGQKQGNDVWCYVPDEAWAVMLSMPEEKGDDRWFPFNARSVSDAFIRIRKECGLHIDWEGTPEDPANPNLRFHDLRHECTSWLFEKSGLEGEHWDVPRVALVTGHQNWNSLKRYANLRHTRPFDKWKGWEWKKGVLGR